MDGRSFQSISSFICPALQVTAWDKVCCAATKLRLQPSSHSTREVNQRPEGAESLAERGAESSLMNYTGQILVLSPLCKRSGPDLSGVPRALHRRTQPQVPVPPPRSEFTHGGRADSSLPPFCLNPVQPEVTSSRVSTLGVRGIIMKAHFPSVTSIRSSLLSLFVQMVSTNNASEQCHYCERAAGNVSSAPFPASST